MKEIDSLESRKICGGGISLWGMLGIGSLITFIGGFIDGIARPFKCH